MHSQINSESQFPHFLGYGKSASNGSTNTQCPAYLVLNKFLQKILVPHKSGVSLKCIPKSKSHTNLDNLLFLCISKSYSMGTKKASPHICTVQPKGNLILGKGSSQQIHIKLEFEDTMIQQVCMLLESWIAQCLCQEIKLSEIEKEIYLFFLKLTNYLK